jgi:hypothetical protein
MSVHPAQWGSPVMFVGLLNSHEKVELGLNYYLVGGFNPSEKY